MNNIPEEYKQTEVGVIPEEWEVKTLGEKTTKIGSGITPTGGEKVYKSEGRHFLRSQNVGWGNLLLEDIAFIDDEIHNTFKGTEIIKNDVFLNITGASIGRSAIADERVENGNVNQHVCIIRTIENELNPKFLNYFLLSKNGQKQIDSYQAGGNRQGLNFGQIKSFQIPLPPLPEQQAIASALSDVDALITALEQLITKKRNIKQGAMQQLLTGKKRLPGFSGEWEVKKLGEIAEMYSGGTPNTSVAVYYKGKIPWVVIADMTKAGKYIYETEKNISDDGIKNSSAKLFNKGTLLFAMYASIGKCSIAKIDLTCNQAILGIEPKKIDTEFLYYYLFMNEERFGKIGQTGTQKNLNKEMVQAISIPYPHIKEQQAIARILSDMDTEIEALEQKRDKYRALKQGMMQELLTGKTRLV